MCNINYKLMTLDDIADWLHSEKIVSKRDFSSMTDYLNFTYSEIEDKINKLEKNMIKVIKSLNSKNKLSQLFELYGEDELVIDNFLGDLRELKLYRQLMINLNNHHYDKMIDQYVQVNNVDYDSEEVQKLAEVMCPPKNEDTLIYLVTSNKNGLVEDVNLDLTPSELFLNDETIEKITRDNKYLSTLDLEEGEYHED